MLPNPQDSSMPSNSQSPPSPKFEFRTNILGVSPESHISAFPKAQNIDSYTLKLLSSVAANMSSAPIQLEDKHGNDKAEITTPELLPYYHAFNNTLQPTAMQVATQVPAFGSSGEISPEFIVAFAEAAVNAISKLSFPPSSPSENGHDTHEKASSNQLLGLTHSNIHHQCNYSNASYTCCPQVSHGEVVSHDERDSPQNHFTDREDLSDAMMNSSSNYNNSTISAQFGRRQRQNGALFIMQTTGKLKPPPHINITQAEVAATDHVKCLPDDRLSCLIHHQPSDLESHTSKLQKMCEVGQFHNITPTAKLGLQSNELDSSFSRPSCVKRPLSRHTSHKLQSQNTDDELDYYASSSQEIVYSESEAERYSDSSIESSFSATNTKAKRPSATRQRRIRSHDATGMNKNRNTPKNIPDAGQTVNQTADRSPAWIYHPSNEVASKVASQVNPDPIRGYPCPYPGCIRSFGRRYNLRTHYSATHIGERQFGCPKCDKRFARKADLNRHCRLMHGDQLKHPSP